MKSQAGARANEGLQTGHKRTWSTSGSRNTAAVAADAAGAPAKRRAGARLDLEDIYGDLL